MNKLNLDLMNFLDRTHLLTQISSFRTVDYNAALKKRKLSGRVFDFCECNVSDFFVNTIALWNELRPQMKSLKHKSIVQLSSDTRRKAKLDELIDLNMMMQAFNKTVDVFNNSLFGVNLKRKVNFPDSICFIGLNRLSYEFEIRIKVHRGLAILFAEDTTFKHQFYHFSDKYRKLIITYLEQYIKQFDADPSSKIFQNLIMDAIHSIYSHENLQSRMVIVRHLFNYINEKALFFRIVEECKKLDSFTCAVYLYYLTRRFSGYFISEMNVTVDEIEDDLYLLKKECDTLSKIIASGNGFILSRFHECPERGLQIFEHSPSIFSKIQFLDVDSSSIKDMFLTNETLLDLAACMSLSDEYKSVINYLLGKKSEGKSVNEAHIIYLDPLFKWCLAQIKPEFLTWNYLSNLFAHESQVRHEVGQFLRKILLILWHREDLHKVLFELPPDRYYHLMQYLKDRDVLSLSFAEE